ncbi:hypothetical protein CPB85DRAFT_874018 [Mucidula mucida]|nr:hypothetical protein CPB85DRAFT_874018 [Mucidula mucida]
MSSIRPGTDISVPEAEDISQRILELARRLRRYGVSHTDLHSSNIDLRHGSNDPVLIDWGRAEFHALSERTFAARWTEVSMRQDFYSNIRKVLRRSDGNIWRRFSTPLSDAAQKMLVEKEEWSWRDINTVLGRLSEEQLEMLYCEDLSVDRERGLRWRVKPGVKTTTLDWDDPVPPY